MRIVHLLAALPLACVFAGNAFAQCGGLKLLEEVPMQADGPGPFTVSVQVNGSAQSFVFSTSGGLTQISRDTAKSLNLPITQGDTGLFDATGKPWHDRVTVKQFAIGRLENDNMNLPVAPSAAVKTGLFSLNFMRPFDVDADFAGKKLRFFSQDHCPGGVMYWQAPVSGAVPITVTPTRLTAPVMLDGKAITAVIDTGAPATSVSTTVARQVLGLDPGTPDTPLDTSGRGQSYSHVFKTLNIGGIPVSNVTVRIASQGLRQTGDGAFAAANRAAVARADLADPVLTLGMDVLSQLHLYFAFKEGKLYLSPAAPAADIKSP